MVAPALPNPRLRRVGENAGNSFRRVRSDVKTKWLPVFRATNKAVLKHVQEHAYTMAGLACFDAAGFTHSQFVGLIVTGASFFAFELKNKGV